MTYSKTLTTQSHSKTTTDLEISALLSSFEITTGPKTSMLPTFLEKITNLAASSSLSVETMMHSKSRKTTGQDVLFFPTTSEKITEPADEQSAKPQETDESCTLENWEESTNPNCDPLGFKIHEKRLAEKKKVLQQYEEEQKQLRLKMTIQGITMEMIKYVFNENPDPPPPPTPMTGTTKIAAATLQTLGNILIIVSFGTCIFLLLIVFRNFTPEVVLTCSFDFFIILGNLLIIFVREPNMGDYHLTPTQCKGAHLVMFFTFACCYGFGTLLARQVFYIVGSYLGRGWQSDFFNNCWFSIMSSATYTLIWGLFNWDNLMSETSCMGNFDSNLSRWIAIYLIFIVWGPISTMVEGAFKMEHHSHLHDHDPVQFTRAKVAGWALFVVFHLVLLSHFATILAVHYQNLSIYTIVFALNIATAILGFWMQIGIIDDVRKFVSEGFKKIFRRG